MAGTYTKTITFAGPNNPNGDNYTWIDVSGAESQGWISRSQGSGTNEWDFTIETWTNPSSASRSADFKAKHWQWTSDSQTSLWDSFTITKYNDNSIEVTTTQATTLATTTQATTQATTTQATTLATTTQATTTDSGSGSGSGTTTLATLATTTQATTTDSGSGSGSGTTTQATTLATTTQAKTQLPTPSVYIDGYEEFYETATTEQYTANISNINNPVYVWTKTGSKFGITGGQGTDTLSMEYFGFADCSGSGDTGSVTVTVSGTNLAGNSVIVSDSLTLIGCDFGGDYAP